MPPPHRDSNSRRLSRQRTPTCPLAEAPLAGYTSTATAIWSSPSSCVGLPVDVGILRCLTQAQPDAPVLRIDANHAHLHLIAFLHDFLGMIDAIVGHLGDVDQAFDGIVHLGERTERGQPGDLSP